MKGFFDNKEELVVGAAFGLSTVFVADFKALLIIIPCALFWRLGGVEGGNKWFRRLGVSLSMVAALFWATHSLWCLVPFALLWAPLSLGYGLPDAKTGDKGSALGAFYFKLVQIESTADIYTRMTIGAICGLCLAPLMFVDPLGTALMILFIVLSFPAITVLV